MNKDVPFVSKVRSFHFGKIEIGQVLHFDDEPPLKVTRINSVEMIVGDLLIVKGVGTRVSDRGE